jgi:hypothetical protein
LLGRSNKPLRRSKACNLDGSEITRANPVMVRIADPSAGGGYRQASLGRADDTLKADGVEILDYKKAEANAREWITRHHRIAAGMEPEPPLATPLFCNNQFCIVSNYTKAGTQ